MHAEAQGDLRHADEAEGSTTDSPPGEGLQVPRHFTQACSDPYAGIAWKTVDVRIKDPGGRVVFEALGFEVPDFWSYNAATIVAQKYAVRTGGPDGGAETSVRQVIDRVVKTFRAAGVRHGYFHGEPDAQAFEDELRFLLVTQRYAFNSPVWFNTGRHHVYGQTTGGTNHAWDYEQDRVVEVDPYVRPQMSACFIQPVEDTIDGEGGVMDLLRAEAKLFKYGSGTGSNFSRIRGKGEPIRGGGTSSGVMSFLKILDANAGSIKSGGTTRRAAKMVILDDTHPEILDFIAWKRDEERKAKTLIQAGYDSHFEGEAYTTVSGQNSNNSVMLTDAFLAAVENDETWELVARTTGESMATIRAREMWDLLAECAWECADPGVMFHDTIQKWHTCKNDGPIQSTNPCAEYIFLDNTSCNLGSLNILRFHDENGNLQVDDFLAAIRLTVLAKDIIVTLGSFPVPGIAEGTTQYRTLGLGYANVGTTLMMKGLPYDSAEGRAYVAGLTALMTSEAYLTSIEMAKRLGTFPRYETNRDSMLEVVQMHVEAARFLATTGSPIPDVMPGPESFNGATGRLAELALSNWQHVLEAGSEHGFRNAQVVVIAPTGTIGFMMGCSTTGIEPAYALRVYKTLAGGGGIMLAMPEVGPALRNLGYTRLQVEDVEAHITDHGSIVGAPHVASKHHRVFETADDALGNSLDWRAHLWMTAAVQPFLSGGVSKTINLPRDVGVDDIKDAYALAHRLGMKNTAVFRDGCKDSQPLRTERKAEAPAALPATLDSVTEDQVRQLLDQKRFHHLAWGFKEPVPPKAHHAENLAYTVGGVNVHVGLTFRKNGGGRFRLNQVFLNVGDQGDHIFEHARDLAIGWSRELRLGEKATKIASKCINSAGRGAGMTDHPLIKACTSLKDFVWKVIMLEVYGKTDFVNSELLSAYEDSPSREPYIRERLALIEERVQERRDRSITEFLDEDGAGLELRKPVDDLRCPTCGAGKEAVLVTGTCKTCTACGHSFGGC